MAAFLESEKPHQVKFKQHTEFFSDAARLPGLYDKKPRDFCLPLEHSIENLYPPIRASATAYFARESIAWHDAVGGLPSNHLCDSQVCCVNFLFPFATRPDQLLILLRPFFPNIDTVLPVEDDLFVAFEWIGAANYLGERTAKSGTRTRGANATSADAVVRFRATNGEVYIVLLEWKYTESYPTTSTRYSDAGTDRLQTYLPLLDREDSPIALPPGVTYDDLFYNPFDQLMRQQLLGHAMELHSELGASSVSLLHVSPAHNSDFPIVTSPSLRPLGSGTTEVWSQLLRDRRTFIPVSTEEFFRPFGSTGDADMSQWWRYIGLRYRWVTM